MGRPQLARRAAILAAAAAGLLIAAPAWAATTPPPDPQAVHDAKIAGRWALLIAIVGLVVLLPLVLWLVEFLVKLFSGRANEAGWPMFGWIRSSVMGADKRISTSKTMAVLWTYSLASALLAIVIAKLMGHPMAYDAQVDLGLQGGYGVLIGGPLGAAILAKAIVNRQVAGGQSKLANEDKKGAKASDLVNNDAGDTDMGDLQYVLFNAVGLTFFFGTFLQSPQKGLPTIPDVLLGLMTISTVGYVGKKALPAAKRVITKVNPTELTLDDWRKAPPITIFGSGLLSDDGSPPERVLFENAEASVKAERCEADSQGAEGPTVHPELVADNARTAGTYDVLVITKEGNRIVKKDALTVTGDDGGGASGDTGDTGGDSTDSGSDSTDTGSDTTDTGSDDSGGGDEPPPDTKEPDDSVVADPGDGGKGP